MKIPRSRKEETQMLSALHEEEGRQERERGVRHLPFRSAFLNWHAEAAPRLLLPVAVKVAGHVCTELRIKGVNPAISVSLCDDHEVVATVSDADDCWDFLMWSTVYARKIPDGWTNVSLVPEARTIAPTREALWRADCFEPLLDWINTELAPATHVGLWGERDCATWARLLHDIPQTGLSSINKNGFYKFLSVHSWSDTCRVLDVD